MPFFLEFIKPQTNMKKLILNSLLAFALVCFFACSNNQQTAENKQPGTTDNAEEHNDAKFNNENEKDAEFVVDAVEHNLIEISLCDLALQRATHPEVKELAQTLSDHHTKANNELVQLAQKKNITVPSSTPVESSEYKALNDKSGTDFEKSYYNKVVEMHKDAVSRFEKAAQDLTDSELRNYAANQLPTLRTHLDRTMDGQKLADNWK
jgi:putative membrane protein